MNPATRVATHDEAPVQFLNPEGELVEDAANEEYLPYLHSLGEENYKQFFHDMVITRHFDEACTNLQRQGQLGLWVPSHGQEGGQVGSAYALKKQDHVFPSYREHAVGLVRGIDLMGIAALLRGVAHGGWDPTDPKNGNFRLYTLVIGSQTLHATGYAMGQQFDGVVGTGNPDVDEATIVYFGDGASSQGDVSEAFVFAASYQTPQVFFLQNNHWAISVPVSRQSRTPLYRRGTGFGMPSVQIDGNDVLAGFAVTSKHLDDARSGRGPSLIEALTYRVGAHTTSDDPTKYRTQEEVEHWIARDPITRLEKFLRSQGVSESYFSELDAEAKDFAADIRTRTLALEPPPVEHMFNFVYSEPHANLEAQAAWHAQYEASFGEESATNGGNHAS
ncbi:thiamine pyrophosphate-dependent dehydrogenase E1 component subunit alpha [Lysinibacter sp. HNR]|uniref:thiamine pyrophosphate-dependent dehydrogenase E1 component subunit alpha n=1 Tax=Lysinibacter sp. HNR TaxID=3031408 RepID=UPI002435A8FF|nr:thiamine pyrophosphate-dependent dehydrogenase E1 component subunit alpha [Lysinibacter sp. HNR]WGD37303.1 thiamine pyrophosphate-dependent dehydrogenase E1 component subunit alpha [Lysinibacter sp. HNR]